MWSENEIMEVIAAAIIGAAGTIAALALSIWGTGRKGRALVEKDTKLNSKEHDRLSAEHDRLKERFSIEHHSIESSIRDGLSPIRQKTESVHDMLLEEKAKRETWYSNLSGSQRDMKAQFDSLQRMAEQWQRLVTENKELTTQNQSLKEQVALLTKENALNLERAQNAERTYEEQKEESRDHGRGRYRGPGMSR